MKMIAALLLVAASATAAAADTTAPADASDLAAQDCARARKLNKKCVLSFTGEEVDGKLVKSDGFDVSARGMTRFASLIRLRRDFRTEIIRAAEDL